MKRTADDLRLLTAAELELMHVLWTLGEATVQQVLDGLQGARAYTTVATLLKILDDKGFAAVQKDGRKLAYRPAVDRPAYEATAVRDVVERVFAGDAGALVRTLVEHERLRPEDLQALRALLEDK
ncbi:MAG: BlaI/MecI/CopY family transcriptional regulator [Pseudomonadota bacterium]|nr:BlaI/MecI/CopY family transcriptional regulator [Pseudomonadota bacterium]